ncbi:hypothetical protein ACFWDI_32125 [Streptomyces sp. NPDC060064]|uniref:hypothetical protein n=1 Tax=Streptomyces sp. NPDC060064 TaxID=3347049 RepID=UPI003688A47C
MAGVAAGEDLAFAVAGGGLGGQRFAAADKNPLFPALRYTAEEWQAFRQGMITGSL